MFYRKACIACNTTHCEGIDRVMSGNGYNPLTIAHDDVLALPTDSEAGLFKGAYSVEVPDARYLGHGLNCHFDFANILTP